MADLQFAPPIQRLAPPPRVSSPPPPPPPPAPAPAPAVAEPTVGRGSLIDSAVGSRAGDPRHQQCAGDQHPGSAAAQARAARPPSRRRRSGGKKLLSMVVVLGILGGGAYLFRNAAPIQKLLGHDPAAAPLPDDAVRAADAHERSVHRDPVGCAERRAQQRHDPRCKKTSPTALVRARSTVRWAVSFTSTKEIRTTDSIFRPGQAYGKEWSRQPRVPETPSPFDTAEFIPMISDIIDQPLRDAMQPTSSKATPVNGETISTLTYVIDRAKVPEIAPSIYRQGAVVVRRAQRDQPHRQRQLRRDRPRSPSLPRCRPAATGHGHRCDVGDELPARRHGTSTLRSPSPCRSTSSMSPQGTDPDDRQASFSTNASSWRRLRHSYTPSVCVP